MNKLEELRKAFEQMECAEFKFVGALFRPEDAAKLEIGEGTFEMPDGTFRTVRIVYGSEIEGEGVDHEK